jgi:hypothetical protein
MKLINVSKRCLCNKRHRMDDTDAKHLCRCDRIVAFTDAEKRHFVAREQERQLALAQQSG